MSDKIYKIVMEKDGGDSNWLAIQAKSLSKAIEIAEARYPDCILREAGNSAFDEVICEN